MDSIQKFDDMLFVFIIYSSEKIFYIIYYVLFTMFYAHF